MHAETVLTAADLIWPLFVTEGQGVEEPIASLPGVSRWSVERIVERAREAVDLGIPCLALFPNTPRDLRTARGEEALNPDNLMCRAVAAIRDAGLDIGVLTDVALDPYTEHGHDGIVDEAGYVLNDETADVLDRSGAQPGPRRGRHHRPERHDGRPRRPDPRRAGGGGLRQRPDHGLRRQIRERLLRPVPRRGRQQRPAEGRQENLSDGPGQRRRGAARSRARFGRGRRQRDGEAGPAVSRHRPPREGAVRGAGLRVPGVGRVRDDRGRRGGRCGGPRCAGAGDADGVQARRAVRAC